MEWYPWVVFLHVAAAFLFVMGHGASMWVSQTRKDAPDPTPVSAAELAALVDSRRPDVIALVGFLGLLMLLWLMMFKPF